MQTRYQKVNRLTDKRDTAIPSESIVHTYCHTTARLNYVVDIMKNSNYSKFSSDILMVYFIQWPWLDVPLGILNSY